MNFQTWGLRDWETRGLGEWFKTKIVAKTRKNY